MSGRFPVLLLALPMIAQEGSILTGRVRDAIEPLPNAYVELRSISKTAQGKTDADGTFRFANIPAGQYTIKLQASGFQSKTLRFIMPPGGVNVIPAVELRVSSCGNGPMPEYLQPLHSQDRTATLSGIVKPGPYGTPETTRADVSLVCEHGRVCGQTRTNGRGEFSFPSLTPGYYSLKAFHVGYYADTMSGYEVQAGFDNHFDLYIERCPAFNCDAALRPPLPVPTCE